MRYYWFNKNEILQNTKKRYSKEKAAEYYFKKQRSKKRKVKESIQNLVKRRKIQD